MYGATTCQLERGFADPKFSDVLKALNKVITARDFNLQCTDRAFDRCALVKVEQNSLGWLHVNASYQRTRRDILHRSGPKPLLWFLLITGLVKDATELQCLLAFGGSSHIKVKAAGRLLEV